jgi:hypothetical protein
MTRAVQHREQRARRPLNQTHRKERERHQAFPFWGDLHHLGNGRMPTYLVAKTIER